MIKIKEENTSTVYKWQALDGTIFNDENECKKYEQSARGVILARVKRLVVGEKHDAWSFMGGCDDHEVEFYKVHTQADADAMLQWIFYLQNYLIEEQYETLRNKIITTIEEALKNKDYIIMGLNYDGDYYFINSRQNVLNNLLSIDKNEKSE